MELIADEGHPRQERITGRTARAPGGRGDGTRRATAKGSPGQRLGLRSRERRARAEEGRAPRSDSAQKDGAASPPEIVDQNASDFINPGGSLGTRYRQVRAAPAN